MATTTRSSDGPATPSTPESGLSRSGTPGTSGHSGTNGAAPIIRIRQDVALTENLSAQGARVYMKTAPPDFDFVRLTNLNRSFESKAQVCNRYTGIDGFERLCLKFLDNEWPF